MNRLNGFCSSYKMSNLKYKMMMKEKAGEVAGKIWNVLNGTEGLSTAQIKKAAELADKELYLGLGWLLREDKVATEEVKSKVIVTLK